MHATTEVGRAQNWHTGGLIVANHVAPPSLNNLSKSEQDLMMAHSIQS